VSGNGKGDHFPLPLRNGGDVTVPCCVSCHDMKDRYPLNVWPLEWILKVVQDFPNLSRETKIFLAKAMFLYSDGLRRRNEHEVAPE
jgi:hypothetical protein